MINAPWMTPVGQRLVDAYNTGIKNQAWDGAYPPQDSEVYKPNSAEQWWAIGYEDRLMSRIHRLTGQKLYPAPPPPGTPPKGTTQPPPPPRIPGTTPAPVVAPPAEPPPAAPPASASTTNTTGRLLQVTGPDGKIYSVPPGGVIPAGFVPLPPSPWGWPSPYPPQPPWSNYPPYPGGYNPPAPWEAGITVFGPWGSITIRDPNEGRKPPIVY